MNIVFIIYKLKRQLHIIRIYINGEVDGSESKLKDYEVINIKT